MKYNCSVLYDAAQYLTIEADTLEEASEKAMAQSSVGLCHQCSDELEVGDALGVMVSSDSGSDDEDRLDTTWSGEEIARLKAEVERLKKIVDEVHSWAVCAAIATPEDMAQNFPHIVEITGPSE
jgi:hypothetical protein